jgi:hypothetical protein
LPEVDAVARDVVLFGLGRDSDIRSSTRCWSRFASRRTVA